jgi:hypothetical protein
MLYQYPTLHNYSHVYRIMAKCRYLKFPENTPTGWDISKAGSGLLQAKQLGDESLLLVFSPFKWKKMLHLVKQLHAVQVNVDYN